ncbi:PT domain-containing protein, partial [Streptomyces sp. NPDC048411]|uniref:PT domain-containing protein n=1 Tax=Streptomyces sp. NPDC048411 TaxID=3157206 RepID=UPI003454310D
QPANRPTGQPANRPTGQPANRPTGQPANRPTAPTWGTPAVCFGYFGPATEDHDEGDQLAAPCLYRAVDGRERRQMGFAASVLMQARHEAVDCGAGHLQHCLEVARQEVCHMRLSQADTSVRDVTPSRSAIVWDRQRPAICRIDRPRDHQCRIAPYVRHIRSCGKSGSEEPA